MIVVAEVSVPLSALGSGLLYIAAVAALVALTFVLVRLAKLFGNLTELMDDIHEPLESSVKQLPTILEKLDKSLVDVNKLTETAGETLPEMLEDISVITGSVSSVVDKTGDLTNTALSGVQSLAEGLNGIVDQASGKLKTVHLPFSSEGKSFFTSGGKRLNLASVIAISRTVASVARKVYGIASKSKTKAKAKPKTRIRFAKH